MVEKSFDCQVPCEGVYADVKKIPFENPILKSNFEIFRLQYNRYRRFFENAGGNFCPFHLIFVVFLYLILEAEMPNTLRFVRIFFDTPTFDRITKDRAAKPVDMLSAIGGTMGLLTGFSIISAVEIVYFVIKISSKLICSICNKIK